MRVDFAYSGNIQQSRSDEINRNIMAFYRAELFLNDDYAIVLHNVSLLTQKREPSPRAHVLVRSVPAPKEAASSLADSSAIPRNVTIPLGGIPHSFYTGFAGVPESGLLFHSGTHVQLLLTNYPRCLTDESLVLSVASSVGSIEIPIQFRYSPLMEQICIRNFSLATSAYLYEWGLRACVRRSMRVVILLVLSMVVLFLCFLFTGIRVNPFSTMEGKLLSLLLPEGDRGVYYELNGSEGIAVVSEGLKKSRMATVQGLSRNSGTKIVESDFVREEAKKVKEEAKVKKELVKEEAKPVKEPVKAKKEEKSLLETVVTKNQKAEKAKLPSERLEELAQRLQKEERRKKKEKKEKERRLAEKKKEEEKKEAKPVVEAKEVKPVEEKPKESKAVEEVKEVKPMEEKSKPEEVKESKPMEEKSKPAPEVKEVKKSETRVEARKDKDVAKDTTDDKAETKTEDKPKEDKPEPKKVEKKKEKNHVEKPAKKPLVPVTPSNEVAKPASNETPGETPMSPLSVTPSVVSVLEEASSRVQTKLPASPEPAKPVKQFFTAESPQAAPKSGIFPAIRAEVKPTQPTQPATPAKPVQPSQPAQPAVKPKEKKSQSRSSTPAAKVKAKQASRSTSRQQKAVPDAVQKPVSEATQPASEQPPKPSVFAQRQDVDGFGNASAFQPDYGMFDSSLLPNAAWGNRGYTRNHLMGEDFYPSRGYDRQMNYDMNYAMGGLRDPVNYNRSSLLGEMNYGQLNGFDEYNAFSNYTNILPQDTMRGMQNARSYTPVGYDMPLYNEARERSSAWLSVGAGFDEALNDSLYNDRLFNYDRMNDQMMNDIDDLPSIVRDPDAVVFPSSRSGSAVRAEGTPGFGGSDCGV